MHHTLSSRGPGAPNWPARNTSRAEGSGRGHVQARARQRSPKPRPRLPWGPYPAALTRVRPSPTNSVGEGVPTAALHVSSGRTRAQGPVRAVETAAGTARSPPARTAHTFDCARPAGAWFRSPPPLRSGGRGPGGGGLPRHARQPLVRDRSLPSPGEVCPGRGGGGARRGTQGRPSHPIEVLPSPAPFAGEGQPTHSPGAARGGE
jgi:hypothetical protein